jgi:hypothetical protein
LKRSPSVGSGEEAITGRVVEVLYVGVSWRAGEQFDASWDRGNTFKFGLGRGQGIAGWDQGVTGMKVGGRDAGSRSRRCWLTANAAQAASSVPTRRSYSSST